VTASSKRKRGGDRNRSQAKIYGNFDLRRLVDVVDVVVAIAHHELTSICQTMKPQRNMYVRGCVGGCLCLLIDCE
jgi:hypothetical protein